MKHAFKFIFLLTTAGVLTGCAPPVSDSAGQQSVGTADGLATSFAQGKEARAWMATGVNHFFEGSDEAVNGVVEELYQLGAVEVRVTDGEKFEESSQGEIASILVAKLPDDEAKRKALFDYEMETTEDATESRDRDYVEIIFD